MARSRFTKPRAGATTSASWWECLCDCGVVVEVRAHLLRKGETQSCGCLHRERSRAANTTHGGHGDPEYAVWSTMKTRCSNPNSISWPRYGALGIRVCDKWVTSYAAFIKDVGPRPSAEHSIDRIDPYGNYEPDNVQWATVTQQNRNRKTSKITPGIAAEIRSRFLPRQSGGVGNSAALAAEFGISGDMVRKVARGLLWAEE